MAEEKKGLLDNKKKPDWNKFGLTSEAGLREARDPSVNHDHDPVKENELFRDVTEGSAPWWKANFLVTQQITFGTWDGVFTSCMINIFGVVIFLRTGWVVGNVGILLALFIIFLTISVAFLSVLSAIGVCERCKIESGGVYFVLSHVLGGKIGAAVGIVYCIGQSIGVSLFTVGFGESIASLANLSNIWVAKGIAIGVVLVLLAINGAGVKWVIRLQLLLLVVLAISVVDFCIGSIVTRNPSAGVLGFSQETIRNNTMPSYQNDQTFFSVFGVFFPTATGVFAGINMSGELEEPKRNIPVGTLSAIGVSLFLYILFALILGGTCAREFLQTDYLIAQKVSALGPLFLCGLYISTLSGALAGLSGSSRVFAAIAANTKMPVFHLLSTVKGTNKVPIFSLLTITAISLLFILIGDINVLGPIVTMPFMLTYAAIDYAYFALAMSYDLEEKRNRRIEGATGTRPTVDYKSLETSPSKKTSNTDLDKLFPERLDAKNNSGVVRRHSKESDDVVYGTEEEKHDKLLKPGQPAIYRQPRSWYSVLSNRWLSAFSTIMILVLMFGIRWEYALATIFLVIALYLIISHSCPGAFPGVASFSFLDWLKSLQRRCCRMRNEPYEEIVVNPQRPEMQTAKAQLTEDNDDYSEREKYHQSRVLNPSQVPGSLD